MLFKNINKGRNVVTVNGTKAKVVDKNSLTGLVCLSFEVVNGYKTDNDGWWDPKFIVKTLKGYKLSNS